MVTEDGYQRKTMVLIQVPFNSGATILDACRTYQYRVTMLKAV